MPFPEKSILQIDPTESIVMQYYALPQAKRDKALVSAFEEVLNEFLQEDQKQHGASESIDDVVANWMAAYNQYQHIRAFISFMTRIGRIPHTYNQVWIEGEKRILQQIPISGFYPALQQISKLNDLTDAQRKWIDIILNEAREHGYGLDCRIQKKLAKIRDTITQSEIFIRDVIERRKATDIYPSLQTLLINRARLSKLCGYANFAEMKLANDFYFSSSDTLLNFLRKLKNNNYTSDSSILKQELEGADLPELIDNAVSYVCMMLDVQAESVQLKKVNGVHVYEINQNHRRKAWLSVFEGKEGNSGSTNPMRAFYHAGNQTAIPDIAITIKLPQDGKIRYQTAKTILHELGHAMFHIFSQNELAELNESSTNDTVEFPSTFLEGMLQDFLEQVYHLDFTNNPIPLKAQMSIMRDSIERATALIEIHQLSGEKAISKAVNKLANNDKYTIEKALSKSNYAINFQSYAIGAYLAEQWHDTYRNLASEQERREFIKQYIHFCSQGRMANSEKLFTYSGGFLEGVGEGLEK